MNAEPLILAVDDEAGILTLLKVELEAQGFRVITAQDGAEALQQAQAHQPDAILLDVLMPEISGLEVMQRLRETKNLPIILVTARDSEMDKVRGLELGADDYIVKPFSPEEVGARLRAVLRRVKPVAGTPRVIKAGDVDIDLTRRLVLRDGEVVPVTRSEWQLLQYLAANPGKVLLNGELLTRVWGPEYRNDIQYLRVWVSRLRHKIERDPGNPEVIKTIPGIGYLLQAEGPAYATG